MYKLVDQLISFSYRNRKVFDIGTLVFGVSILLLGFFYDLTDKHISTIRDLMFIVAMVSWVLSNFYALKHTKLIKLSVAISISIIAVVIAPILIYIYFTDIYTLTSAVITILDTLVLLNIILIVCNRKRG